MPAKADLPDTLKALVDRQALVIQSGPDFRDQADRLIRRLETEQFEAKKEKLQQDVQKAIDIANQAPKMALSGGRDVLELIMQDVYRRRFSEPPGDRSLEILTERLPRRGIFPINSASTRCSASSARLERPGGAKGSQERLFADR